MPSKLIRSIYNLTQKQRGGVITIGNFDGVHVGHQQLLAKVREKARALALPSLVITFEPHPFEFFAQGKVAIPRLTRLREKFDALASCGIENVLILPFNQILASKPARNFILDILYANLNPKHIIVGDDFHFGYQRKGDVNLLQSAGRMLGFTAEAVPAVLVDGERVSSTRIRRELAEGNLLLAQRLLGRPYSMLGRVGHGDKLGRQLGFPTLNIHLHRQLTPIQGVYTVYVYLAPAPYAKPLPGAANIGTRPSIDGTRCLLEVHLLNFNQDLYGRYVKVEFCEKLHEEIHYPNVEILKEHIAKDVETARNYFQKQGVL